MVSATDHVIADLSICTVGSGVNISKHICEVLCVLKETGLKHNVHACGTNIEGPLDKILETVQKCIAKLHDSNIPRLDTTLRIQSRTDKKMGIDESIKCTDKHEK
ncbi:thiamine-binding protein [Gigaspora margarita]|uniref:Thiamine-binding protein n=1 Tax=Gigaspora margarita TaxID=4874 RepID=A0A8H4AS77_GIGMA|nr:thiamine-binding protein [Gigaspora margarita]